MKINRNFLKSGFGEDVTPSDQSLNKPQPPLVNSFDQYPEVVDLVKWDDMKDIDHSLTDAFYDRESHRAFKAEALSLKELSYLLYATQGVKDIKGDNYCTIRTVPSAGARHPFETYLVVMNVEDLKPGLYAYHAINHQLHLMEEGDFQAQIIEAALGQKFAGRCAVTFIWTCVPYRGEWRYVSRSYKPMLLDAGHLCQNLYLACEALGAGTCAIAAYDQEKMDDLVNIDGDHEFSVYISPVGKV